MSAEIREEIATALSAVDGVTCSTHYRQSTRPGVAMVRLGGTRVDDSGFGWVQTWQVLVILPKDIAASEKWLDEMSDEIASALSHHLLIQSITPTELVFSDGSSIPTVSFEGTHARRKVHS